jgi:hypothetical protein
MVVLEDYKFSRYGPLDLDSPDQFWIFSNGCHEEDYHRNIYPDRYILYNGDSYSHLHSNIDKVVRLFFYVMLVLVRLPVLIDYFNGYTHACSLGFAVQNKIIEESSLVFTDISVWYLSLAVFKKIWNYVMK